MAASTSADLVTSLVRTWVPILVGGVISWAATEGITVSGPDQGALITVLTSVIIAVYYTVVRIAEQKWPVLSVLLGSTSQPTYAPPPPPAGPAAAPAAMEPPGVPPAA